MIGGRRYVRFTPKSGHVQCRSRCPLRGQKRTSAETERMPQGGLYFCKSNVSQCEHVAGGTALQPAV
jgi:hypothetical protein